MKQEQQRVRDWMMKFGQETHNCNPVVPSLEVRKLRAKLILEEALETIEGLGIIVFAKRNIYEDDSFEIGELGFYEEQERTMYPEYKPLRPDLVKIADGIADSLVVQLGTAVACGIDIQPVFEEVMRSNDSKLWKPEDLEFSKDDNEYHIKVLPCGNCLVKDKNGKVIKSPSYSPPNIQLM